MIGTWVRRLAVVIWIPALWVAFGCAPSPRSVPCSNDGECWKASESFRYCLQSHCVECVSRSNCGEGNACIEGRCEIHCRKDRDCPAHQVCKDDLCGPL